MTHEACDELVARISALGFIMVQKGVCTVEEIELALVQTRQALDQKRAKEKEEALEKIKESGPVGELLLQLFARGDDL